MSRARFRSTFRELSDSAVVWNVRKSILGTELDDVLLQLSWRNRRRGELRVALWLQTKVVSKQTTNVWRSHGSTRKSSSCGIGANVGRQDVETRSKDVHALAVVREVGSRVGQGRGTHSDSILRGGWRVVTSVGVVVTCGNGKVQASLDCSIDCHIQGRRLATTKRHVGGGSLEAWLFLLSLSNVGVGSKLNTLDDVRHRTRAVGSQNLDGNKVGVFRNTVVLGADGTSTVGTVTVTVDIVVTGWDSLSPLGSAAEVLVVDIDTCINDCISVGDSRQSPWSTCLSLSLVGVHHRVHLDKCNVWVSSDKVNDSFWENTGIAREEVANLEDVSQIEDVRLEALGRGLLWTQSQLVDDLGVHILQPAHVKVNRV
ncbi:hypothetical protein OGATHE_006131 [Ogataea polymorpha]|uniref:Uncharacterized protein n=1 Tax=Ogataea polymorpha TaxID=460523 RepID=A0A9P8NU50_9ASCO|nr:hypothetical protein OGATHE_006131 [Ogataea polymorpha]